jgi:hypothetical protein
MLRRWNGIRGNSLSGRRIIALHLPISPSAHQTEVASARTSSQSHTSKTKHPGGRPAKPAESATVKPPATKSAQIERLEVSRLNTKEAGSPQSEIRRDPLLHRQRLPHHRRRPQARQPQRRRDPPRHDPDRAISALTNASGPKSANLRGIPLPSPELSRLILVVESEWRRTARSGIREVLESHEQLPSQGSWP